MRVGLNGEVGFAVCKRCEEGGGDGADYEKPR